MADAAPGGLSSGRILAGAEVYERAGLAYTPEFERRMRAWLDSPDNRVDRYGRYPNSYEPFGLEAAGVGRQFAGLQKALRPLSATR